MKVLILGASGFIGLPVARAFIRAGHIVYGQTRSNEKAKELEREEIRAVVCDPKDTDVWGKVVEDEVDVVITCVGGGGTGAQEILDVLHKLEKVAKSGRPNSMGAVSPKLTFIATGGSWVYAAGPDKLVDERREPVYEVELTAWRKDVEVQVLSSTALNGIVIRPALLYGYSGSLLANIFGPAVAAKGGKFEIFGSHETRLLTVHADDVADLYLRVAERAEICKGLGFAGGNDATESMTDIVNAVAKLAGASGWSYRKATNPFEEAQAASTRLRPNLAKALVGWQPKKMSLRDGIEGYWMSWKASQED